MDTNLTEVTTERLIKLLVVPNGLRLQDLLYLQGEKSTPQGDATQLMLTDIFPQRNEVEVSMPDKGHRLPRDLKHRTLEDAIWFPTEQLQELIRHAESSATSLDSIDIAAIQTRIAREREEAARERETQAFRRRCDAALQSALDSLSLPDGTVQDWHLVLLGMFKHREQLTIRIEKEEQFFEDRVTAAREYGRALRSSPRQWAWQIDILRRSADKLRATVGV